MMCAATDLTPVIQACSGKKDEGQGCCDCCLTHTHTLSKETLVAVLLCGGFTPRTEFHQQARVRGK